MILNFGKLVPPALDALADGLRANDMVETCDKDCAVECFNLRHGELDLDDQCFQECGCAPKWVNYTKEQRQALEDNFNNALEDIAEHV